MQNQAIAILLEKRHNGLAKILRGLDLHKYVFYDEEISKDDEFDYRRYEKELQEGGGFAERLGNVAQRMFQYRFDELVLLLECDWKSIDPGEIQEAIHHLHDYHVVIKPTESGGICFLALNGYHSEFFTPIIWEHSEEPILDLILTLKRLRLTYLVL